MRATRIKDYWKGADGYCRSFELITKKYSTDDIANCGKEIVLFGWFPQAMYLISALKEAGIIVKYVCEVDQIPSCNEDGVTVTDGLILKDYRELIRDAKKYYFIFFAEDNQIDIWTSGLIKRVRLLQYGGGG